MRGAVEKAAFLLFMVTAVCFAIWQGGGDDVKKYNYKRQLTLFGSSGACLLPKQVVLTLDGEFSPEYTPKILAALSSKNIRATFFLDPNDLLDTKVRDLAIKVSALNQDVGIMFLAANISELSAYQLRTLLVVMLSTMNETMKYHPKYIRFDDTKGLTVEHRAVLQILDLVTVQPTMRHNDGIICDQPVKLADDSFALYNLKFNETPKGTSHILAHSAFCDLSHLINSINSTNVNSGYQMVPLSQCLTSFAPTPKVDIESNKNSPRSSPNNDTVTPANRNAASRISSVKNTLKFVIASFIVHKLIVGLIFLAL